MKAYWFTTLDDSALIETLSFEIRASLFFEIRDCLCLKTATNVYFLKLLIFMADGFMITLLTNDVPFLEIKEQTYYDKHYKNME